MNSLDTKNLLLIILIILIGVVVYFNFSKDRPSVAQETVHCLELWEQKKDRYFGEEIGNYRVIFNKDLDTCIAGNIYNETKQFGNKDKYFIFVIDLLTDETLFGFQLLGEEETDDGVTQSEAWDVYRSYGLKI